MALPRITSPHTKGNNRTQRVMLLVLAATLPGVIALTWLYGVGTLINLLWASAVALGCEALILRLRQRPVQFFLRDGSALGCDAFGGVNVELNVKFVHQLIPLKFSLLEKVSC